MKPFTKHTGKVVVAFADAFVPPKGEPPIPPFSVKPDKKVNVRQVMSIHRDVYEGTPFDQINSPLGGPFGLSWGSKYPLGTDMTFPTPACA